MRRPSLCHAATCCEVTQSTRGPQTGNFLQEVADRYTIVGRLGRKHGNSGWPEQGKHQALTLRSITSSLQTASATHDCVILQRQSSIPGDPESRALRAEAALEALKVKTQGAAKQYEEVHPQV